MMVAGVCALCAYMRVLTSFFKHSKLKTIVAEVITGSCRFKFSFPAVAVVRISITAE